MTTETPFEKLSVRDARNRLSRLVRAAEAGRATVITKRGQPAALIIPVEDARRLYPGKIPTDSTGAPSFADWLMSIPVPFVVRRSRSGMRHVEFLPPDQESSVE